jgi:hypothetical protein
VSNQNVAFKAIYHSSGDSRHNDSSNPAFVVLNSNCGADMMDKAINPSGDSGQVHRYAYFNAIGINKGCNIVHAINTEFRCKLHVK